ncbi:hypothetical protein C1645_816058 [Glomus cerebriforme]|uniref:Uncharacterized protein n=1 Tax=Glomus cerebriforme TaxID=658196 RepID=A0A397THK5_9GLOM|nr:hypothetical protein C1645_816058 [Glomus cerebriforme]
MITIITNKTNNKTDSSEKFSQLYDVFLYKKKDITAIQKKLSINNNVNQIAVHQSNKAKTLANSYELLLELVGDLIPIQEKLGIDVNPILKVKLKRDKASSDKLIKLFDSFLSLEDDIVSRRNTREIWRSGSKENLAKWRETTAIFKSYSSTIA